MKRFQAQNSMPKLDPSAFACVTRLTLAYSANIFQSIPRELGHRHGKRQRAAASIDRA